MQAEDEILALPIAALLLSDWENDDLPAVTSPQVTLETALQYPTPPCTLAHKQLFNEPDKYPCS